MNQSNKATVTANALMDFASTAIVAGDSSSSLSSKGSSSYSCIRQHCKNENEDKNAPPSNMLLKKGEIVNNIDQKFPVKVSTFCNHAKELIALYTLHMIIAPNNHQHFMLLVLFLLFILTANAYSSRRRHPYFSFLKIVDASH